MAGGYPPGFWTALWALQQLFDVVEIGPTERTAIRGLEPLRLGHGAGFEFVHRDDPTAVGTLDIGHDTA